MNFFHAQDDDQVEGGALGRKLGLTRRGLFAATTGMVAAAAVTALPGRAWAASPIAPPAAPLATPLIRDSKRGIILYTVRDAISRDPNSTPLPSGFKAVFKALSDIGYERIEFAGYTQHANAEGGPNLETIAGATLLRKWLDDNGLRAEGNHGFIPGSWPLTQADLDRFKTTLEISNILGMDHMGTGNDPTNSNYKADWDIAAAKWNTLGEIARNSGYVKLYTHNHDVAYNFLLDSGPLDAQGRPTRSSGIRRLEYFLGITDPKFVNLEMDIYWAHVAQYRYKTYTAPDGSIQTNVFNPLALVQAQEGRYPLFHAKDGKINTATTNGYDMVPFGTGNIDYTTFFRGLTSQHHYPMYEQDTAPGNAANPNQSLQFAEISYNNMAALTTA
ncbi:Sugar phosphate isomerase/epimerase [Streptosporangium subroseum]|uniref:Sugar phosphate isomerase/epimerase n=1 Tax=Streptosporangium subroseum TaxID=106412 RepID=A0A239LMR4_9ACTN|nr:TIM barrel protein [Streptosporangium subroseum]SNT31675.1 Sugar phosphate isomerase/epimerase [Streptosporangium subroseum]